MMNYHESWPPQAVLSFERSIAAHGGWRAWDDFKTVSLKLTEFRGLLPFIKGLGTTFFAPKIMRIDPKNRIAEFDKDRSVDGQSPV